MDKIARLRQEIDKRLKKAEYEMTKASGISHDNFIIHQAESNLCRFLLDFLDTLSEEPDKDLEEAARLYAIPHYTKDIDKSHIDEYPYDTGMEAAFIAGAKWQAEQDDRDVVFWKGMQYAIKGMKEDAVEGIYTKSMDGKNVFVESGALKIDPASVKVGDKVKLIIIKDDGKSD